MTEANLPKGDRVGNDYSAGNNPNPGGDIDTDRSELPPYDGRTTSSEGESKGTKRAFGSEEPAKDPVQPGAEIPASDAKMAPKGVGESTSGRGEDVIEKEGKEEGRIETGTKDSPAGRPTGESTGRDASGVDAQEDEGSR
ncbi:hypothetical protein [Arthrobacter sp. H5]|uniref:hypothetical protein n=1 Tax=Arthrobacter sp. H5 TaxID=1267973 RepID=UPI0004842E82|nr:hypothetical protein [Arthrobacter sp. H5]